MPSLSLNPFKTLESLLDRDGRHLGRKGEVVDDMIELRRKIDAYESGTTIGEAATHRYRTPQARQSGLEKAVLEMLG